MVRRHVQTLQKNGTFDEYNSPPTMASIFTDSRCGVSMGRPRPSRRWASRWKRIYGRMLPPTITPNLKNVAGPYDRAYGMDLRKYVSLEDVAG